MNTRNLTVALLAVGTLAGVTGCGDSGAGAAPATTPSASLSVPSEAPTATSATSAPSSSSASTPSTSALPSASSTASRPATLSAVETQAALAMVDQWQVVMDQLTADPAQDLSPLQDVATGSALTMSEGFVKDFSSAKLHTKGSTTFVSKKATHTSRNGTLGVAEVDACVDTSALRVLSEEGKDVTARKYGDRMRQHYTLNKQGSGPWKMVFLISRGEKC